MSERRGIFYLTVTMVAVVILSTAVSLLLSYRQALHIYQNGLVMELRGEKRFLEGSFFLSPGTPIDTEVDSVRSDGTTQSVLIRRVKEFIKLSPDPDREITYRIALQKDDRVLYSNHGLEAEQTTESGDPILSDLMKAALDGKEQSFQGLDHTGHYITAASTFLTYAGFRIGLVGTVSNHDVVARLMQNAVITLILSLLFAVSAAFVFQRLGNPILVKLSRQSRSLKRELETRRGVETQLSESVEFLSESQRIGHVGSYSLDIASGIWTASDVLENLFGIDDRIEHTLEMWVSLIHPADREKASGHFLRHVLTEGNRFDLTYRIIRKNDGAIRWLHCLGELTVKDGVAVRMVGTIRDVTENTELIQSLRSWEQLFAHSAWGIVIVDAETNRIVSSNPALDTMYGYSHDELIGMSVFDLYAPESRPVARGIANDMSINHDHCCFESLHVRKDGTRFPVEVDVCARDFDGTGTPHIRAANIVDISERKRIESDRERAERSMMETQRLESLGVLAGGIAHDFNNVLMTVLGNANLALQEISTESAAAVHLESIVTAAGTASGLTRQMLAYAGKGKYDVSTVLLNKIVSQMSALLDVSISKSVMLRTELDPTDPVILADEAQIQQVVMNLVVNASEAIGAACGTVTITTGIRPCDHVYLNSGSAGPGLTADAELPEGDYAVLEVADSGSGMDEKTLARLFDPFFSTKYQGRGLGLASVQGIVRGHHGVIRVNSELGKGTTFKILFPLDVDHDSVRPEVASDERLRQSWTGSGLVLLADDDDSVRNVGKRMLERFGFDVIEARDGRAAVDLFTERADEFVCAIIDLTMPHLDGTAVVRELNAIRPDVKILICSGYNEQSVVQELVGKGLSGFLQKPFLMETFRDKLREILGSQT